MAKNLRIKGISTEVPSNTAPSLPLITNNKGGSIIIQNWNTKNDIPPEIENVNLPIIVDRSKIQHGLPDMKESLEKEKNKKDELYIRPFFPINSNLNFKTFLLLLIKQFRKEIIFKYFNLRNTHSLLINI